MSGGDALTVRPTILSSAQEITLGLLPGLNARAIALTAARGAGKTRALREFMKAEGAVFAIDPAGELGRLCEDDPNVEVVEVPSDFRNAALEVKPGVQKPFLDWLVARMRAGRKVVCVVTEDRAQAPQFADAAVEALRRAHVRNLLLIGEEAQRFVGQSRGEQSDNFVMAVELGRNWGWGVIVASQRPASIDKEVLARCDTLLLGRVQHPRDVAACREMLELNIQDPATLEATLRAFLDLPAGHFILREPAHLPTVNQ